MEPIVALPIEYVETQTIFTEVAKKDFRSILFCSPDSGDGVSTIAYSVAQKAVSSGKKVLLVEFTTRTSFLADRLKLARLDWSMDNLPSAEEMITFSRSGLTYLPAPSSMGFSVSSRQVSHISEVINRFLEEFDLVVIDAPPVCRPNLHGIPTQMLAPQVDGVFMVISTNQTGQNQIRRTVDILVDHGTNFAGSILNDRAYPSLFSELQRQFEKAGRFGSWFWSKISKPIQNAPFMTDSF